MEELAQFFRTVSQDPASVFNPEALIAAGGLTILFLIIFAETGLFFCFFFPGDSLVFTAGVLCATGDLNASWLTVCFVMVMAAILGNMTGFFFGKRTGPLLMKRKDTLFFKKDYVRTADDFYKRYGGLALVMGRFLPIIRTFAPIVAGILNLTYSRFLFLSVVGAVLWVVPLVTLGYFLGSFVWVRENLEWIVVGMVVVITTPVIFKVIKSHRQKRLENVL